MAFGVKTNERPGTRAQVRYSRVSAYKAREVLNLIRGKHVVEADQILTFVERDVALVIRKCLTSAVANATNNDEQDPETLFVSACYADEGPTLKRWRPRARGRATRIRKRTCHITIIVSPMPAEMAAKVEAKRAAAGPVAGGRRGRGGRAARESRRERVARSRGEQVTPEDTDETTESDEPVETTDVVTDEDVAGGEPTDEVVVEAEEDEIEADEAEDEDVPVDEATEDDEADDSEDEPDASKEDK
jgi:large subunit ribosomal protein L22